MSEASQIDLAHAGDFAVGTLIVRPSLRQVVAEKSGAQKVVEPRVMQVLVALVEAQGAIVTRDELTQRCWNGRVVGDDAINRVISRLRRLAEGIGGGSFRIETVTKVGYRLLTGTSDPAARPALRRTRSIDRRTLLAGAAMAAGAAALTGLGLLRGSDKERDSDTQALLDQAAVALQQGTVEGLDQSIGLLRRAVANDPRDADAWGALAIAYAVAAQGRPPQLAAGLTSRAREAVQRALQLDPGNPYAGAATARLIPPRGGWGRIEPILKKVLADDPDHIPALYAMSNLLAGVGRCREAADMLGRAIARSPPMPGLVYSHVQALWAAGRLEEADRAMSDAFALYPTHFGVWFTRFYFLLYTGRAEEALAQSRNVERRPTGISPTSFPLIEAVAVAMASREAGRVDEAVHLALASAAQGAGYAENAVQFASALGRPASAFQIAEAYYFGRGFVVNDQRFVDQRIYTRPEYRRTQFLFFPSTAAMRAGPAFADLVGELGLEQYWAEAKVVPDYRRR